MVFSSSQWWASSGDAPAYVPKGAMWFDSGDGTELTAATRTSDSSNKKRNIISAWRKGSYPQTASGSQLIGVAAPDYDRIEFAGTVGGTQLQYTFDGGGSAYSIVSVALLRDPTAWQHLLISFDSTQASGSRVSFYYNGVLLPTQTYHSGGEVPADFESELLGNSIATVLCDAGLNNSYFSEFIAIDGKSIQNGDVAISAFGTENSDGVWIPVDPTTVFASGSDFGNNGFYLDFADSSTFGNDVSGNNNDFTSSNTTTANWSYDRPADDKSSTTGNLGTWNPLQSDSDMTLGEGNTKVTGSSGGGILTNTIYVDAEDADGYYYRCLINTANNSGYPFLGIHNTGPLGPTFVGGNTSNNGWSISCGTGSNNGKPFHGSGTGGTQLFTFSSGDYVDICIKAGKLYFGQDGTWSGDPDAETGEAFSGITGLVTPAISNYSGGTAGVSTLDILGGTAPTGAKRFTTYDLPSVTVTKPTDNFLPILYEGNGAGQRVGNFIPFTDSKTVTNSAVFDSGGSDYLSKTYGAGAATSSTIWTFSTWFKRGLTGGDYHFLGAGSDANNYEALQIGGNGNLTWITKTSSSITGRYDTDLAIQGPATWYNLVISRSGATITISVNGVVQTNFSTSTAPGASDVAYFGRPSMTNAVGARYVGSADNYWDGYLAETVFIDGTAYAASSFGQTDTSTNRWIPKDVSGLTFGNNGYYFNYSDSAELGDDTSGQGNDFAENNLVAANQTVDTPTQNYSILKPPTASGSDITLSGGNLIATGASGNWGQLEGTLAITEGTKGYYETKISGTSTANIIGWGESGGRDGTGGQSFAEGDTIAFQPGSDALYTGTASTASWASYSAAADDILMFAYDATDIHNVKFWFGEGGTWFQSGDPAAGTNAAVTYDCTAGTIRGGPWVPLVASHTITDTFNFGSGTSGFTHTAPTDFLPLSQNNMAENTAGITGFSWIKNRDAADFHVLSDRVSGVYKYIPLYTDAAEDLETNTNSVQRFLQQGVQVGNMNEVNTSAESFVLWQWVANGAGTTNTDGSGADSTVSVNTTAEFSILTYTGDGVSGRTIGTGLTAQPAFMIVNNITDDGTYKPQVYHQSIGNTGSLTLTETSVVSTDTSYWNDTSPATSAPFVFSVGNSNATNRNLKVFKAYVWAEVEGYSKFGSWTGNGDADGPFIYCGFKPEFVIHKRSAGNIGNWIMQDAQRNPYNPVGIRLNADNNYSESSVGVQYIDFVANGIKIRNASGGSNTSGHTYIYMAFAENPFGGSGIGQAKAR